jgi:hypothetical protein
MTATALSNISLSNTVESGISKSRLWSGRALSALAIFFLAMDGAMKLFKPPFVVQATIQLGYPETAIVGIGAALLISTLLYALPRTAIFGALLLTGYLGGAVASGVRIGAPLFNIVFPIVFAVIVWASLAMRNPRLEKVLFHS